MNPDEREMWNRVKSLEIVEEIGAECCGKFHNILNTLSYNKLFLLNDYSEIVKKSKSGKELEVGEVLRMWGKCLRDIDARDIEPDGMELRVIPKRYLDINANGCRNKMSVLVYALRLYAFDDFERVILGGDDSDDEDESDVDESDVEDNETKEQKMERIRWERFSEPCGVGVAGARWDYNALYSFTEINGKRCLNFYWNDNTRAEMLRGDLGDILGDVDDGAECLFGAYSILGKYVENIAKQYPELLRYINGEAERSVEPFSINLIIMNDSPRRGENSDACEFLGCEFYELMPIFDTSRPRRGEEPEIYEIYGGKFKHIFQHYGIECGADILDEGRNMERMAELLKDIHNEALKHYNPYKRDLNAFINIINKYIYFNSNINIIYHKNPDCLKFPRLMRFWDNYRRLFGRYMEKMEEEMSGGCARTWGLFFSHSHYLYHMMERDVCAVSYHDERAVVLPTKKYIYKLYEGLKEKGVEVDESDVVKDLRRRMRMLKNRILELLSAYNKYIKKAYFYKKYNFYELFKEFSADLKDILKETREKCGEECDVYNENLFYVYELSKELKKLDKYK